MRPFLHNFIVFVCFGAAIVASFLFGVRDGRRRAATDDVQRDTIVLRDTIRIPAPRPSSVVTQGTILLSLQVGKMQFLMIVKKEYSYALP